MRWQNPQPVWQYLSKNNNFVDIHWNWTSSQSLQAFCLGLRVWNMQSFADATFLSRVATVALNRVIRLKYSPHILSWLPQNTQQWPFTVTNRPREHFLLTCRQPNGNNTTGLTTDLIIYLCDLYRHNSSFLNLQYILVSYHEKYYYIVKKKVRLQCVRRTKTKRTLLWRSDDSLQSFGTPSKSDTSRLLWWHCEFLQWTD